MAKGKKTPAKKKPSVKKPKKKKSYKFLKVVGSILLFIILSGLLFYGVYALLTNIEVSPFGVNCIMLSAGMIEMFLFGVTIKLM